jgi:hypothetical protein
MLPEDLTNLDVEDESNILREPTKLADNEIPLQGREDRLNGGRF